MVWAQRCSILTNSVLPQSLVLSPPFIIWYLPCLHTLDFIRNSTKDAIPQEHNCGSLGWLMQFRGFVQVVPDRRRAIILEPIIRGHAPPTKKRSLVRWMGCEPTTCISSRKLRRMEQWTERGRAKQAKRVHTNDIESCCVRIKHGLKGINTTTISFLLLVYWSLSLLLWLQEQYCYYQQTFLSIAQRRYGKISSSLKTIPWALHSDEPNLALVHSTLLQEC